MKIEFDARLELDDLNAILARRGLLPGGRVQAVVDEAVLRYCAPKVPFDTGYLIRQALQTSIIGQGLIVYGTPYARYLYYGEVYGPNIPIFEAGELAGFYSPPGQKKHPTGRALTYQGAPERGAFWFERMKAEHREDIVREAAAAAGGRAK
jgi:hypothetical protein